MIKKLQDIYIKYYLNYNNIKKDFSYGKWIKDNTPTTKKERLKAIKRFLDNTR
tara:strand:- start:8746 stop:8904 length:159 start_codon:yes stop_codon:yes gene_type:complete